MLAAARVSAERAPSEMPTTVASSACPSAGTQRGQPDDELRGRWSGGRIASVRSPGRETTSTEQPAWRQLSLAEPAVRRHVRRRAG